MGESFLVGWTWFVWVFVAFFAGWLWLLRGYIRWFHGISSWQTVNFFKGSECIQLDVNSHAWTQMFEEQGKTSTESGATGPKDASTSNAMASHLRFKRLLGRNLNLVNQQRSYKSLSNLKVGLWQGYGGIAGAIAFELFWVPREDALLAFHQGQPSWALMVHALKVDIHKLQKASWFGSIHFLPVLTSLCIFWFASPVSSWFGFGWSRRQGLVPRGVTQLRKAQVGGRCLLRKVNQDLLRL